jgi:MFS family permease
MSFAIRGGSAAPGPCSSTSTNEQVGQVLGAALWGFTLAMIFGGPLCDIIGLRRIVAFAFVGHLVGILLTIFAWNFWSLFAGNLIFGIANGSVEAACNPLITTLFPDDKTTKLNHFHMWFPGGIVIGGVLAYFMSKAGFSWKAEFATMLLPLVAYGILFMGLAFPKTERVEKGISTGSMWAGCLNPLFLLMVACMVLTATTELGSTTWIT